MAVSNTALTTMFGVIEMVLFSGVIYGWANLVLILKDEEYFKDLCESGNSTILNPTTDTKDDECAGQDYRLALVFTIAVFSFNAAGFFGGVLFDHLGTRLTRLIACGFFFIAGLLAFFMEKDTANLIFAVLACLAIAGMLLAISLFQIAELHPKHRLAVSSSLSGALDSSSVVFLIFKVCYDSGASFRWILIIYVIIAIVCVVVNSFVFLPKMSISLDQKNKSSNNAELETLDAEIETPEHEGDRPRESTTSNGSEIEVHSKFSNGWRYILTSNYIWLFYYFALVQLRLWFFVGSLNIFLTFRSDNDKDKVDSYSRSFGIAQFFGFVFAPFTGIVMDLKPKSINNPYFGPIVTFIITNLLCLLLGVLVLVPVLEVQYLSFVVQVAMRAFLYASLISFILRAFPVIHYGKLYGVCTLAGAIVSLLQYPAIIILEGPFDGDPFWVNFGFLTLSFTGLALPLYLWISNRKNENATAHVDAIEEPESEVKLINLQHRPLI